jgi:hypothetical protein
MTYREKLKKENPNRVDSHFTGGCSSCPHKFGYCTVDESLCDGYDPEEDKCRKCWDQTIPGTEKKIVKLPPDKKELKAMRAVFKDGHVEEILYATEFDPHFVNIVTASGIYAWNEGSLNTNCDIRGDVIKHHINSMFVKVDIHRDVEGILRTTYINTPDIDHIEFEEVEVDG